MVVLDLGLPDVDGLELCHHLHVWPARPIIVVSGDVDDERIVAALRVGADDYVAKPVALDVLAARIDVQLRHAAVSAPLLATAILTVGDVRVDLASHEADVAGRPLELNAQQFTILATLMRNVGKLVSYDVLARALGRAADDPDLSVLRSGVSRLRRRLEDGPSGLIIVAERHVGYRLLAPERRQHTS